MSRGSISKLSTTSTTTTPTPSTPTSTSTVNKINVALGSEIITGTPGGDAINMREVFNAPSGTYVKHSTSSIEVDGLGNTDTISIDIDSDQTPYSIVNVEEIYVSNKASATKTLDFSNVVGATKLVNIKSAGGLVFSGVKELPTEIGFNSVNDKPYTVTVKNTLLSGANDSVTFKVKNIQDAGNTVVTMQPSVAGSGFEVLTVNAYGDDSVLRQLTDGNGNSLKTINITGESGLTIADVALDSTVTTIDASAKTAGGVVIGKAGSVSVPSSVTVFKGGAGDDTLFTAATFNEDTKTYLGGAGTDTIGMTSAKAASITTSNTVTDSKFSGWEVLAVENALAGDVDLTLFGSTMKTLALNAGAGAVTVTVPNNAAITTIGTAHSGTLTILPKENVYNYSASLTVPIEASAADHINGQAVSAAKHKTLILDSEINTAQTAGAITVGTSGQSDADTTLIITGNAGWSVGAVTADIIDVSGLTGTEGLTMSAQTPTVYSSGAHITGSANVDVLYGSTGVDIILGGAGDDILHGRAGSDRLTGGAGADTFVIPGITAATNGQDRITDFKHAEEDLISFTGLGYTLGTKVTGAGAAVATTDREDFVQIIDTDGSAGSITSSGTAELLLADLEATTLTNVAAFLVEKYSGVSSTTGTDDGVYIINFTKDGHDKSYIYGWDNDTTANVIQVGELALIGIVTRDAVLVNADITVA